MKRKTKRGTKTTHLSRRSRVRGGKRSAHIQKRDEGRFAGVSPVRKAWDNTKLAIGVEAH